MLQVAGFLLLLSAALHGATVAFVGGATLALALAGLYAVLFFGLRRGRRWVGWIAFAVSFAGIAVTIADLASGSSAAPLPLLWTLCAAQAIAAATLFAGLWTTPARSVSP